MIVSNLYRKKIKRILDILLTVIGLILFSWLYFIVILLIKLTSKGPIFFKQKRIGLNKKEFYIYKFRSMRIGTPKDMPTHLLTNPDEYITTVGKFLRKTSLDELPQLFNILLGDMSIIGPRPALWNQYDLIEEREKYQANSIRPGLTGLAQINGRDELPIPIKAKYDGEYVQKLSLHFDAKIFFLTIIRVIKCDGIKEGTNNTNTENDILISEHIDLK